MNREFIVHLTKMLHFPARLSTLASSHHDLSLAAFITSIAELIFGTHTFENGPIAAPIGARLVSVAKCLD
jgi:hypothetical protein